MSNELITRSTARSILFRVVEQVGLRQTITLLADLSFTHAGIDDEFGHDEDSLSPFHGHGYTLLRTANQLPSEPFPNSTIEGKPAKIYPL